MLYHGMYGVSLTFWVWLAYVKKLKKDEHVYLFISKTLKTFQDSLCDMKE